MSTPDNPGVPANSWTAATVVAVELVPAPTMSWASRSTHTAEHAATTARFSSAVRAELSPVVPSGTMPVAPTSRYSWHRFVIASRATEPSAAKGVMSGRYTPWSASAEVMEPRVYAGLP